MIQEIIIGVNTLDDLKQQVLLFPNPVVDQLQLSFDLDESQKLQIDLKDAIGQNLKTIPAQNYYKDQLSIDMSDFRVDYTM